MKSLEQVKQEARDCFDKDESYRNMKPDLKHLAWTHYWIGWLQSSYETAYQNSLTIINIY